MLNKIASKYLAKVANEQINLDSLDTIIKHYQTDASDLKGAEDKALQHLAEAFNKALIKEFTGTGSSILRSGDTYDVNVLKSDVPLLSRLEQYVADIKDTAYQLPDVKEMEIVWDKDGDPLMLRDVNNNRVHVNRSKYEHIDSLKDPVEFKKALAKVLENQAFRFRAKRAPSAKENKENWAKQK